MSFIAPGKPSPSFSHANIIPEKQTLEIKYSRYSTLQGRKNQDKTIFYFHKSQNMHKEKSKYIIFMEF